MTAARAGCNQVFFGVESVNRENLRSQGKFQNQVTEYKDLAAHLHSLGITCHAGYILGLPFDTPASITRDVAELQSVGFDSASFYILSPLPGSKDHQRWWQERRWMDPDFNTYDSAHVAVAPERMSREELMDSYRKAWDQFYSVDHMVNALERVAARRVHVLEPALLLRGLPVCFEGRGTASDELRVLDEAVPG